MVVLPIMRGLLGIEASDGGRALRFAPQLPINWEHVEARGIRAGASFCELTLSRARGRETIKVIRRGLTLQNLATSALRLIVAPAFPLDARVRAVTINGRAAKFEIKRTGDVQRAEVIVDDAKSTTEIVFNFDEGTDVYVLAQMPAPGATSQGLRILRSRADAGALHLTLEGLGGRVYPLNVRTPRTLGNIDGVARSTGPEGADERLLVKFEGSPGSYVRREIVIPLLTKK
jgi:hypothetical protein